MKRGKKIEKYLIKSLVVLALIGIIWMVISSLYASKEKKTAKAFIGMIINCQTYQEANGDLEAVKKTLSKYMSDEDCKNYFETKVGFVYPNLFYITNAEKIKLKKLRCKKVTRQGNGNKVLEYQVKYILYRTTNAKKKSQKLMIDKISVEVNKKNQVVKVVIFNTSDAIKKVYLANKVQ